MALAGGALKRAAVSAVPAGGPTIQQFLKPGFPFELVSAEKADRIAWLSYEEGKRNVFTAGAPDFKAVRVTNFTKDDGIDLTGPAVITSEVPEARVAQILAAVTA